VYYTLDCQCRQQAEDKGPGRGIRPGLTANYVQV
jgi:hypothetical protein